MSESIHPFADDWQNNPSGRGVGEKPAKREKQPLSSEDVQDFTQYLAIIVCEEINRRTKIKTTSARRRWLAESPLMPDQIWGRAQRWNFVLARHMIWHALAKHPYLQGFYCPFALARRFARDNKTILHGIAKMDHFLRADCYPEAEIYRTITRRLDTIYGGGGRT